MSYRPRVIHELAAEGVALPEDVSRITHTMPQSTYTAGGASAGVLEDGRAVVMLVLSEADADALAAARIARAPSDLLAEDAKPTAHAVADALVSAGFGS